MILESLLRAMDRRDEVFQVIEDSEDMAEAMRRVGELLGVGEVRSRAVLDLVWAACWSSPPSGGLEWWQAPCSRVRSTLEK
ncbi:hypothetical protein [Arthrobacter sp. Marseille-P9274]|uniref:hypothetical protein n=1 Tax=Arthrobacter sp. Marseille-P9274 TaxID=2866572 RepID=UPI0021C976A0|nr:hypothetical protein [Arthrobacter sp. Marseille-P9274]